MESVSEQWDFECFLVAAVELAMLSRRPPALAWDLYGLSGCGTVQGGQERIHETLAQVFGRKFWRSTLANSIVNKRKQH